jgi:hypothetical protein
VGSIVSVAARGAILSAELDALGEPEPGAPRLTRESGRSYGVRHPPEVRHALPFPEKHVIGARGIRRDGLGARRDGRVSLARMLFR